MTTETIGVMRRMSKNTSDRTHQTRILVVDDEADVRLLLAREIGDRGYEVVAAWSPLGLIERSRNGESQYWSLKGGVV